MLKVRFLYHAHAHHQGENIGPSEFENKLNILDWGSVIIQETMKEITLFAEEYERFLKGKNETLYIHIYAKERTFIIFLNNFIVVQYYGGEKAGIVPIGTTSTAYEVPGMIKYATRFLKALSI